MVLLVACLLWGAGQHAIDLATGGWQAYAGVPGWLAAFWATLTLLDPVAAVLLARRRRGGLILAPLILVTDAAANGYARFRLGVGGGVAVAGIVVTALLAVAAIVVLAKMESRGHAFRYGKYRTTRCRSGRSQGRA